MEPTRDDRRTSLLAFAVLAVAVAASLGGSLAGGFVWDDRPLIVDNGMIKDAGSLPRLLVSGFWETSDGHDRFRAFFRPLVSASYALDHAIWGLRPFGFHLTNLLLHLACCWGVYRIARLESLAPPWALAGALLFAVHPVHVESVAWISGRTDLLCTALALAAFLAHRRGRAGVGWVLFLAALFAKEMAILLPAFVFLDRWTAGARGERLRSAAIATAPYVATAAVYVALRLLAIGPSAPALYALEPAAWLATALFVVARYATLLLLPLGLDAHYPYEPVGSLASPLALLGALMVALLAAAGWRLARRSPRAGLWFAWTLVGLAPVLAFGRFGDVILADRFLYLPSVGFCLLAGFGLRALFRIAPRGRAAWTAAAGIVLLALGAGSVDRTRVWRSDLALFSDMLRTSPDSALVHNNLGLARYHAGDVRAAAASFREAVRLDRGYALAHNNLGAALERTGRLPEAAESYRAALEIAPDTVQAERNLGHLLYRLGRRDEGRARLETLHRRFPSSPDVRFALADVYARDGRPDAAAALLETAVSIDPFHAASHYLLGKIRHEQGREDEAARSMRRFLRLHAADDDAAAAARRIAAGS